MLTVDEGHFSVRNYDFIDLTNKIGDAKSENNQL